MASLRLPRFRRSLNLPPIHLTDRDADLLHHVYQHRFIRSDQLISLVPGSRQQLVRRLQLLYHHAFLERPRCQIDYYQSGSRPIAYRIGKKGAALVRRKFALPCRQSDFADNSVGRLFLEHALMVSDFMVRIEVTCRNRTDARLITKEDLHLTESTARKRDPFRWTTKIDAGVAYGIVPDAVFGIEFTDRSGRKQSHWFFLEADRGTMPIFRETLDRTSFFRKLLGYEATWKQGIHRERFGWSRFRVLTLTTGAERAKNLVEATRKLNSGHGLFLFADAESLKIEPDLFSFPWQTTRGVTDFLN